MPFPLFGKTPKEEKRQKQKEEAGDDILLPGDGKAKKGPDDAMKKAEALNYS